MLSYWLTHWRHGVTFTKTEKDMPNGSQKRLQKPLNEYTVPQKTAPKPQNEYTVPLMVPPTNSEGQSRGRGSGGTHDVRGSTQLGRAQLCFYLILIYFTNIHLQYGNTTATLPSIERDYSTMTTIPGL